MVGLIQFLTTRFARQAARWTLGGIRRRPNEAVRPPKHQDYVGQASRRYQSTIAFLRSRRYRWRVFGCS